VNPRTGEIVGAEIIITASTPRDPLDGRIIIYLTALHEIGHALGLSHTDNFDAIMYRFQRPDGCRTLLWTIPREAAVGRRHRDGKGYGPFNRKTFAR